MSPEEYASIGLQSDGGLADTTAITKKQKSQDISAEVVYSAKDSMIIGMNNRKVFLYGDASVTYESIELKADYIEFDMADNQVFAKGMLNDTTKKIEGTPVFTDDGQVFNAQTIKYNFKTRKGYIEAVKTDQEGGFLHSSQTKQDEFGHILMKDGKSTTCDAHHPHFYLALTKAKSIPGDKIISGPAYLVIEDVPLPIGLPFGFFPNSKTSTSGILIPSYGEDNVRGFYLQHGGYYWAINDYMDLSVTGDIYSNGTWGLQAATQYRVRYKYSGNFSGRYFKNIIGDKGLGKEFYRTGTDYSIQWSHNQDPKSNPSQQFRASVNLSTQRFDRNHSQSLTGALTNQKQSSISYQKRWPGSPFNLTASANHSQNSNTGNVNLNLPKVAFSMATIYPFKSKESVTKKWYESIQLSYTSNLDNQIKTVDTMLFTSRVWEDMKTGFQHTLNPAYPIKFKKLKILTVTPNFRYTGVAYTNYINKYRELVVETDTSYYETVTQTIEKISYAHAWYPSLSVSLAPKVYGMYQFRPGSRVNSIRHVISPTVSLSLTPDMKGTIPEYRRDVLDESGKILETYNIFSNGIFGAPSPGGRVRTMSFALRNTLEAKVKEKSDTATTLKKIKLIENLNFQTNMNFDDSVKFQPIRMSGTTKFLNNKVNVAFNGSFDPYATNDKYQRINTSYYKVNGKLAKLTSASISLGTGFSSKAGKKKPAVEGEPVATGFEAGVDNTTGPTGEPEYEPTDADYYYGGYVDFDIPWSIRADYSMSYTKPRDVVNIIQTLRLSGDFSLTPKWKLGYNTGYDLKMKKVTSTNLSIYRDLHCLEMRLSLVPFGEFKSFNFQINVKSALLQDLKYEKKDSWYDNF